MEMFVNMLLTFFTTPLLWVAIVFAFWLALHRIKHERQTFRIAVNPKWPELKLFWWHGLLAGLALSCCILLLGVTINLNWWLVYQIVAVVALFLMPIGFAGNVLILLSALLYLISAMIWPQYQILAGNSLLAELLIVAGLITILTGFLQKWDATKVVTPHVITSSRGRMTAMFTSRQIYLAPVFFLVPGTNQLPDWGFWPVLHIGQQSFNIVILPLILGFSVKAIKELMSALVTRDLRTQITFGGVIVVAGIVSFIFPRIILSTLSVALIICFILQWRLRRQSRANKQHFTKPYAGIRILGVLEQTPAAKMGLEAGDVIVECNGQAISNNENFYQAIQSHSTYCHLKVQDLQGEYRITESAVFADAPHELGVILFPEN